MKQIFIQIPCFQLNSQSDRYYFYTWQLDKYRSHKVDLEVQIEKISRCKKNELIDGTADRVEVQFSIVSAGRETPRPL